MRFECRICVLRLAFHVFMQIRYEHPHQKTEIVRSPFFFVFSLFFSCLLTFRAMIDRARFLLFLHQNRGKIGLVHILVHMLPILQNSHGRGCRFEAFSHEPLFVSPNQNCEPPKGGKQNGKHRQKTKRNLSHSHFGRQG